MLLTRVISMSMLAVQCSLGCFESNGQATTTMTYNIRYDNPNDGENRWDNRKAFLVNQIKFHRPDVLGIQEGLNHQVNYLDEALGHYAYVGVGRDDGMSQGEYSAIFYNEWRLQVLESSTFWLSETPDRPSVGWDASMERICTYARFKDNQTEETFWVFNTHFDHIGEIARANSARLIIATMDSLKGSDGVILMGDLNLEPDHETIAYLSQLLNDSKMVSEEVVFGPEGTFNGFRHDQSPERRIDYIFTDMRQIRVKQYAVLSASKALRYPSDHLPVYVELTFKQ